MIARPLALLLDNYDSFSYNVAQGLVEGGARVEVRRADAIDLAGMVALAPDLLVISPGPGRPEDAELSLAAIRRFAGEIPVLGICLGLQCLAVAYGGEVGRAEEPVHGKATPILHDGRGFFQGLPLPLSAGRYHSLRVSRVPPGFEVAASTEEGIVMALRHLSLPLFGVQFHPDSFLTEGGALMFRNAVHGNL